MTTYGVTPLGLAIKTLSVIRQERDDAMRRRFGTSIPLGDKTLLGFLNGIESEREAQVWEIMEVVNSSQDRDKATGVALDVVGALTGSPRVRASGSTDVLTLGGTPATIIPSGSRAANSNGDLFQTASDATIAALPAWAAAATYAAGDRVTRTSRAYQCTAGGVANTPGPSGTADDFSDGGGVHWRYVGEGTGAVDVNSRAVETGPIVALANDVTTISTPIGGWLSVRNLLDAIPGTDVQTDASYRLAQVAELATDGAGTADAIRAALLQIVGVASAHVFHNDTDATDADGLTPHSVECLVYTPTTSAALDQAIVDVIFANVSAGIKTVGGLGGDTLVTGSATDSEGTAQVVKFSRPALVTVYVDVTLKYDATLYPSDGDAQVKSAIVAFGSKSRVGKDAVAVSLGAQAFVVPGVLDVPRSGSLGGTLIKTSASPTSDATIVVTSRGLATYDTSRVTVHSSAGTP